MERLANLHVRIAEPLKRRLKTVAARKGLKQEYVAGEALKWYLRHLEGHEGPPPAPVEDAPVNA